MKIVSVLCVDVETTGLDAERDHIIEVGAVILHFKGGDFLRLGESLTSLINPEIPIPHFITEINHITDDMVKKAPTFLDQDLRFRLNAMCQNASFLTAHNLSFDLRFLKAYSAGFDKFTKEKQICTLRAARHTWPTLANHKLAFLRTELLGEEIKHLSEIHPLFNNLQDHRALSDVLIDVALLKRVMDEGACGTKSWKKFIQRIQEPTPINMFPFGKYKGRLFTEVIEKDPQYFRWLLKQDWFLQKEDLAAITRKLLEGI